MMSEGTRRFLSGIDDMIRREITRQCRKEDAMKYNTFEEVMKDYYRMEKDWGIGIAPVASEKVLKPERWYAHLELSGKISSVCPVNPFREVKGQSIRDQWIPLANAPQEVQDFYADGEQVGLAGVKACPLVRNYARAQMVVSAVIKVTRQVPCNKIALTFSLEYDSADWNEILPLPVTNHQIHEARVRLYDCAKEWAAENNVDLDLGDEYERPDKSL